MVDTKRKGRMKMLNSGEEEINKKFRELYGIKGKKLRR